MEDERARLRACAEEKTAASKKDPAGKLFSIAFVCGWRSCLWIYAASERDEETGAIEGRN